MNRSINTEFYHDRAEPVMWTAGQRYVRCARCGVIITVSPNGLCSRCNQSMAGWNLENFAKFWADIEYEEAMKQKHDQFYDPNSCLGDSSLCDHDCDNCPAGEEDDEDWEDEM